MREPSSTSRAATTPAPSGKGKKKVSEHPEPIVETSDENDMPASRKKSNRRKDGEGCNDPSVKRARTEDPPAPTPTKETTPPLGPTDQTPPEISKQNPPAAANPSATAQPEKTVVEEILSSACTSASERLKKLSIHRRCLETIDNALTMPLDQLLNRGLAKLLTDSDRGTGWRYSKEMAGKQAEEIKAAEERLAKKHKAVEAKHAEELQAAEAKIAKLEEDLKKKEDSIEKIITSKDKYKEASLINYREAHKLQTELEISCKEVANLEEANKRNLEKYEGAAFQCFYMF
ncbi:uncharacterized protein LOC133785488 [Humulus lupulus]|uniref:uncharacterized protein LOC133785488 n=1 Tax=Humulus lupulus TaxID=3486 RepID=UPI002B412F4D|nr:uncharacterized protein LOC133785488 [Humulus lupulus]